MLARRKDDYLDRVNQALLDEEDDPPAPAPIPPGVKLRNTDHLDVDPEDYTLEPEARTAPKALTMILILLILGAVFVGLALWMKFGGGLPW